MTLSRAWAMPNKWTFQIQPIAELLAKYVVDGKGWIDPFCGSSTLAEFRNDIKEHGATAEQFAARLTGVYRGVLWDPPYSNRQAKECYELVGLKFSKEDAQAMWQYEKKLFAPKIEKGGYAISFGWNSNGFGKVNGFELMEVLLVAHGSRHNDTIVTVERKA